MTVVDMTRARKVALAVADGKPLPKRAPKPEYDPKLMNLQEVLRSTVDAAVAATGPTGYRTGHVTLDGITGRLQPGDVALIGADTNVGKSTFVTSILDVNLLEGKRVLIVTAEDDERKYGARLLRRRTGVSAFDMRDGTLSPADKLKLEAVVAETPPQPFYLDARGVDVEEVAAQIAWLSDEHGFELIACDYITAFSSKRRFNSPREAVEHKARLLTNAMRRSGAAGILVTQLTIDDRYTKPTIHHVRDNRDVGHWVEQAVFLYESESGVRASYGGFIVEPDGKLLHVDKVKEGKRGDIVPLKWDEYSASFQEVRKGDPQDFVLKPKKAEGKKRVGDNELEEGFGVM